MKTLKRDPTPEDRDFEDLKCWQLARQLMIECHKVARQLPPEEKYDLASQVRKSSKSTSTNISEGYGRWYYLDALRFYYFARGSLNETVNHIITAHDLEYVTDARFQELYDLGQEAKKCLNGYINYVKAQKDGHDLFGDKVTNITLDR